jgi:hypothetical protein
MADAFGTTVDGAVNMIVDSLESGGDAFLDARKNIVKKMKKYSSSENSTYNDLASRLKGLEDKFGEDFIDILGNVYNNLENSGDSELTSLATKQFLEKAESTRDKAELENVSDFINSINWGSSIEAAAALREEIQRGSGAAKEFAQTLSSA